MAGTPSWLTSYHRINVNDPGLITLVNKLQDVFTTVGVRVDDVQLLSSKDRFIPLMVRRWL